MLSYTCHLCRVSRNNVVLHLSLVSCLQEQRCLTLVTCVVSSGTTLSYTLSLVSCLQEQRCLTLVTSVVSPGTTLCYTCHFCRVSRNNVVLHLSLLSCLQEQRCLTLVTSVVSPGTTLSYTCHLCRVSRNNVLVVEVYFETFQFEELRTEPSYQVGRLRECAMYSHQRLMFKPFTYTLQIWEQVLLFIECENVSVS